MNLIDLSRKLVRGTRKSRDLVEECLARIADTDGEGERAFVSVYAERARAAAAKVDAARASGWPVLPFAGIPIAIKDLFDDTRSIAEPAGALAVAGMKKYVQNTGVSGQKLVAVVSGANVNFDRLRHISERAEVGEEREVILGVTIPEEVGSFLKFCRALGKRPVSEFNYRYASNGDAHVYVGLQVGAREDRQRVLAELADARYAVSDMTDNEAAKLHVRHMVGGRTLGNKNELLYRFEFPERPGALLQFLSGLGRGWNITMFHYRNHGAAWGRVLVGFEAEPADRSTLTRYLKKIGYRYWEETDNPAYELFLR